MKGGKREGSGRPKGSKNKATQTVLDTLERLGCDPIEGMALIAKDALEGVVIGIDTRTNDPIIEKDYALAGQMFKELAQYIAPKRKASEITGVNDEPINWSVEVHEKEKE